jgi:hypothetical protein
MSYNYSKIIDTYLRKPNSPKNLKNYLHMLKENKDIVFDVYMDQTENDDVYKSDKLCADMFSNVYDNGASDLDYLYSQYNFAKIGLRKAKPIKENLAFITPFLIRMYVSVTLIFKLLRTIDINDKNYTDTKHILTKIKNDKIIKKHFLKVDEYSNLLNYVCHRIKKIKKEEVKNG